MVELLLVRCMFKQAERKQLCSLLAQLVLKLNQNGKLALKVQKIRPKKLGGGPTKNSLS